MDRGQPVANLAKFLFIGVGEVTPTTREVLRRAEPQCKRALTFTSLMVSFGLF